MKKKKTEQEILRLFAHDITKAYSINKIANLLGKAYPHVYAVTNSLIEEGVLRSVVVGRAHLCLINLSNPLARLKLALLSAYDADSELSGIFYSLSSSSSLLSVVSFDDRLVVVLSNIEDSAVFPSSVKGFSLEFHTPLSLKKKLINMFGSVRTFNVVFGFENYYTMLSQVHSVLVQKFSNVRLV